MAIEAVDGPERRGLDRRMETAERDLRQLETTVAVMKATLDGLVSTMDSRHKAFERGQDLILKGIDQLEKVQIKQEADLKGLATAPQDLSKAVFSPGVVVAIIMTIVSIVGGQLASTWGMRSDIRDLNTQFSLRAKADETSQKLQEERATAQRTATEAIGKKQELLQIKFAELRDDVRGQRKTP